MSDPIKRREELRRELAKVRADHREAGARIAEIKREEDPASLRPGGGQPRPLKTIKERDEARVAAARGTASPDEAERLAAKVREVEQEAADALEAQRLAMSAKKQIEQEIAELHREHFAAFAELAERKVAEVERIAAKLLPLLRDHREVWGEAVETWAEPARDYGIAGAPACPLPPPEQVAGLLPRPPQLEPVEEPAA